MNGSYIKIYEWMSDILAYNNNGKDIKSELKSLGTKYKSEGDGLINDDQKSLILICLTEELLA
jgi:hypothetical protein|tara:strand:- start:523 stop:711 length:189 start_codon:yes stop_codon:yes gene_type:complete